MTTRTMIQATVVGVLLLAGCSKAPAEGSVPPSDGAAPSDAPPPSDVPPPSDGSQRPSLTAAECEAKGGTVVGDIGDGAIHRPDYTCESGQAPIGDIAAPEGGPIGVEGSVCCPTAAAATDQSTES